PPRTHADDSTDRTGKYGRTPPSNHAPVTITGATTRERTLGCRCLAGKQVLVPRQATSGSLRSVDLAAWCRDAGSSGRVALMGEGGGGESGEAPDLAGHVRLVCVPGGCRSHGERYPGIDRADEALQSDDLLVRLGGKSDLRQQSPPKVAAG